MSVHLAVGTKNVLILFVLDLIFRKKISILLYPFKLYV